MKRAGEKTLSERIVEDIRAGVLGPGSWLKQVDLEERYDVTRPAVRRVLDELATKRIVEHLPNKGYRVFNHDMRSRREIREVRTVLETHAVDSIIGNAREADVEELYILAEAFRKVIYDGTVLEQSQANAEFHARLLAPCPNRCLVEQITELRHRGPAGSIVSWRTIVQIQKAARDHFLIVDALAAGDAPQMKRVIAHHINDVTPLEAPPKP